MTFGELFAMLGEAINNGADPNMDVIIRAVDTDDTMVVADLKNVSMDAGCSEEIALILDGDCEPASEEA